MAKHTIPKTVALKALLSETSGQQILAEMLGFVADRLIALDVDHLFGAEAHERSAGRSNSPADQRHFSPNSQQRKVPPGQLTKGRIKNLYLLFDLRRRAARVVELILADVNGAPS